MKLPAARIFFFGIFAHKKNQTCLSFQRKFPKCFPVFANKNFKIFSAACSTTPQEFLNHTSAKFPVTNLPVPLFRVQIQPRPFPSAQPPIITIFPLPGYPSAARHTHFPASFFRTTSSPRGRKSSAVIVLPPANYGPANYRSPPIGD